MKKALNIRIDELTAEKLKSFCKDFNVSERIFVELALLHYFDFIEQEQAIVINK